MSGLRLWLKLFVKKRWLKRVFASSVFKSLDFLNEFTNVFELAIYGDVAHVGHGIDIVEFVCDFDSDDSRGDFR